MPLSFLLPILFALAAVLAANTGCGVHGSAEEDLTKAFSRCDPKAGSIYDYMVETLEGKNVSMQRYAGNALLLVNVATYCKYTEQYLDFNPFLKRYNKQGVYIAAFPCNQFHLQEPGNNSEILNGVKYVRPGNGYQPDPSVHIFGKLEVNGRNAHPMYKFLKSACPATSDAMGEAKYYFYDQIRSSDIVWNFEKFIIDRQGRPRYRFHPAAWSNGKFVDQYMSQVAAEKPAAAAVQGGGPIRAN